ncbi:MAG: glycosyl transferase family 1, partial [bacterium]
METVNTSPLKLSDYRPFVGSSITNELRILASKLHGASILNVNSTAVGGGVAEILARLVPLLNDLGIHSEWKVIEGKEDFFEVTKDIHNGLHGKKVNFDEKMAGIFRECTEANKAGFETDASTVIIHDPQPIGLVEMRHNRHANWVWRCHVDVSNPDPSVWNF